MKKLIVSLLLISYFAAISFAGSLEKEAIDPNTNEEGFSRLTNSGKIFYIPSANYGVIKPFVCNVATKPNNQYTSASKDIAVVLPTFAVFFQKVNSGYQEICQLTSSGIEEWKKEQENREFYNLRIIDTIQVIDVKDVKEKDPNISMIVGSFWGNVNYDRRSLTCNCNLRIYINKNKVRGIEKGQKIKIDAILPNFEKFESYVLATDVLTTKNYKDKAEYVTTKYVTTIDSIVYLYDIDLSNAEGMSDLNLNPKHMYNISSGRGPIWVRPHTRTSKNGKTYSVRGHYRRR